MLRWLWNLWFYHCPNWLWNLWYGTPEQQERAAGCSSCPHSLADHYRDLEDGCGKGKTDMACAKCDCNGFFPSSGF